MLLSNFKRVEEIDDKIVQIHRELAELYAQRYMLIDGKDGLSTSRSSEDKTTNSSTYDPIEEEYRLIASAWEHYNIIIPDLKFIKSKIVKASKIRRDLNKNYPEIAIGMRIIAVPPSNVCPIPASLQLRSLQGVSLADDYISDGVARPRDQKSWEYCLVYDSPESVIIGTAKKLNELKGYMIAGYDMRGLGIREYTALTLQSPHIVDKESSTVLLKSKGTKGAVPYASFRQGRYRFEMEDENNVLENDGFRPAIKL